MSDAERWVLEFHRRFGLAVFDGIHPARTTNQLRADLIMEEAREARDALLSGDRPAIAKELGDLVVVTYGAGLTLGIDVDLATYLVHQANMTKTPGNMRADGKLLKGDNYRPPNMEPATVAPARWGHAAANPGYRSGMHPDHRAEGEGFRWSR